MHSGYGGGGAVMMTIGETKKAFVTEMTTRHAVESAMVIANVPS